VESEWQAFVSHHPDFASGRLLVVPLVEAPLPPMLKTLQHVTAFAGHDEDGYRQGLSELVAALLGKVDRSDLPHLPEGLTIPPAPDPGLPVTLRRRLVDWLAPLLDNYLYCIALAGQLGLPANALERYPSAECAASAALVLATADDDPLAAALRITDVLIEVVGRAEPDLVSRLQPLREEIARMSGSGPERGLLHAWQERVVREHGTLVSYFQQRAGFDLLDPVYVQLELRPEQARTRLWPRPRG
jgi:hypothetical protein